LNSIDQKDYKLISTRDEGNGVIVKAYYNEKKDTYLFTENDRVISEGTFAEFVANFPASQQEVH
jgi:hypothetical protein